MPVLSRRSFFLAATATLALPTGALRAAPPHRVATDKRGVAMDGYDTTAYWNRTQAVAGQEAHVVTWAGVPWQFATAAEAAAFEAEPTRFAPKFGAFCTRAMSFGKVVNGDPEVWRIYGDALYLFAQPVGGRKFDEGQDAMIAKAQAQWDKLA